MKMRFVYHEVEKGLEFEYLNADICRDRIVEVGCTGLNYKSDL